MSALGIVFSFMAIEMLSKILPNFDLLVIAVAYVRSIHEYVVLSLCSFVTHNFITLFHLILVETCCLWYDIYPLQC